MCPFSESSHRWQPIESKNGRDGLPFKKLQRDVHLLLKHFVIAKLPTIGCSFLPLDVAFEQRKTYAILLSSVVSPKFHFDAANCSTPWWTT